MKQVIVEIDERLAALLEKVAPARSRKRSAFVRDAIRRALDAELERLTAEAYRRMPQSLDPWYFDPEAWEPRRPRRRRR
ncbi:MAG: hypothetical protein HY906_21585 [Deltaproteobacteria bacterium]|nr:hypothetical protein [Deltaproteobacteria bacterium]